MAPLRSIEDGHEDDPVVVSKERDTVRGQRVTEREPDVGEVKISETRVKTDTVIIDPDDPRGVQVPPEGSTVGIEPPLASAFDAPTAEEVFAGGGDADDAKRDSSVAENTDPFVPAKEVEGVTTGKDSA